MELQLKMVTLLIDENCSKTGPTRKRSHILLENKQQQCLKLSKCLDVAFIHLDFGICVTPSPPKYQVYRESSDRKVA